jgi:hypothetical protein
MTDPTATPDFDAIAGGDDLAPDERERLRAVHDLLVSAGPPPEVSPALLAPQTPPSNVRFFRRRYRSTLIAAAAALAVVLFAAGYLVGHAGGHDAAFTVPMRGANAETASLVVYDKDAAGNWPMRLDVTAATLREGAVYELWLTKAGKLEVECGAFLARPGKISVPLNAPYRLRDYDGWIIVPHGSRHAVLWTKRDA